MIAGRKVIQLTLGYCAAEMFAATRAKLEGKWTPGLIDEKWLTLNKYPLPSVEENEAALLVAAEQFGYRTWNPGADLGAVGCINAFFAANPQPPGTICVGIDPDSFTEDAGFDKALCEVVIAGGIPFCALRLDTGHGILIPDIFHADDPNVQEIAGHKVFVHPSIMMVNTSACIPDVLFPDGLWGPVQYWGGTESFVYERIRALGGHLGYLMDYGDKFELRDTHDPRYAAWKWEHFYGRFLGSFAEYLACESSSDGV
jgi:hypothetical protein